MRLHALLIPSRCGLLALAFFGCAAPAPTRETAPTQTVQQAIVDGEDDEDDPAVVALMTDDGKAFCSGVLVSTHVVATAAHCLDPSPPAKVFFGALPAADEGTTIAVAKATAHPKFNPDVLANDIALLTLAEKAPAKPIPVHSETFDDSFIGRSIRLVGFGAPTADSSSASLRKRSGTTEIDKLESYDFKFNPSPAQTCLGDSGGPAFATFNGKEALIGIASSGDADCASYGRHIRVDRYGDFIESYVTENTPSEALSPTVPSAGCSVAATRDAHSAAPLAPWVLALVLGATISRRQRTRSP
jgi:MYXO-CTERM domain-containing protein